MKTLMRWLNRVVTGILVIVLVSLVGVVISTKMTEGEPEIFGYQLKTVLSGSMEPDIQTGSLIAIESSEGEARSNFTTGDVITFQDEENNLITHRIMDVTSTDSGILYTTQGDNNNAPDSQPVLAENVIGEYQGFTIPYAGYVINFAQSLNGILILMIVPGVLIFCYSAFTIWKSFRELENKVKENATNAK